MIAALVPLKPLDAGKSRLAGLLPRPAIAALSLAMLGDILEALAAVERLDHRIVVTPDPAVGKAAEALGAEAMVRDDPGLNASLDEATALLVPRGLESLLVVLGDVAGARSADLEELFVWRDRLGTPSVALAAARDGGTAALLRTPYDAIPSRFGPDSAARHQEAARERGIAIESRELPSLAIDLDRPDDLKAMLRSESPAPRTRALLHELGFDAATD